MNRQTPKQTQRAKSLRATQTEAEGLLWSLSRGKQLGNMTFRRQHPIGPFFADFACVSQRLAVEWDGGYHDLVQDKEVLRDVESVLIAIASTAGIRYSHRKRTERRSGMMSENDPNAPQPSPHPAAPASDLPGGEVKDV